MGPADTLGGDLGLAHILHVIKLMLDAGREAAAWVLHDLTAAERIGNNLLIPRTFA